MSTTVHIYKSTDAGAPAVSGEVDKLRALLQAILVDGYNTKTITITRSGTTATANSTAHGYVTGHVLDISGASQSDYNGQFKITRIDADNFSYTVANSPTTPATGTISAIVAPMGWTQPYTGTNKGAFLQPAGSTGLYLRMDDSNAQNTQWRGYETMSDVDTGTNLFPTNAQVTVGSGPYFYKSSAASSTARTWKAFGDKRSLFLVVNTDGSSLWHPLWFGDFHSFVSGDAYPVHVIAASASSQTGAGLTSALVKSLVAATTAGNYIARAYGGSAGAITTAMLTSIYASASSTYPMGSTGAAWLTYPATFVGGFVMEPIYLTEAGTEEVGPRGRIRGVYAPQHGIALTDGDTFSGAAGTSLAGRTFEYVRVGTSGSAIVQTTDWSVDG